MKIGYVRVSTVEQNTARQEVVMSELGVDKVYIDKVSGKDKNRPALTELLSFAREGDVVIVESISRFARNTKDLLELLDTLASKGVKFVSQKENIDTSTSTGKFMLTVFGAVAELEREYLLQRQREGIAVAKDEGKYTGRKPISYDETLFKELYWQWKNGDITQQAMMKKLNMSRPTLYRRIKEYEQTSVITTETNEVDS